MIGPDGTYPIEIVGLAEKARFGVQPGSSCYPTFEAASKVKNPDAIAILPSMVLADPEPGVSPSTLADRITEQVTVETPTGQTIGVEALDRDTAVSSLPGVAAVTTSFNIIQGLAFIVVTLVVGIFFVILTVQKAGALTLLRAIGASTGELIRTLLVQVVVVMLAAIGTGACFLLLATLASSEDFPITFDPMVVITRGAVLLVLALVASLAAIRRVLKIDPIAATVPAGIDL